MELNSLGRKVQQLEETFENTEEKLKSATDQLVQVQHAGDESERYLPDTFIIDTIDNPIEMVG